MTSIKGFRNRNNAGRTDGSYHIDCISDEFFSTSDSVEFHTGEYDRDGAPIFEGDWLRSMSCTEPFQVSDLVSFLKQCGAYEATHGVRMCDSLVVVKDAEHGDTSQQ